MATSGAACSLLATNSSSTAFWEDVASAVSAIYAGRNLVPFKAFTRRSKLRYPQMQRLGTNSGAGFNVRSPTRDQGHTMPHLKSLYPPIPQVEIPNYFEWLVNLDVVKNSPNITLYIDGLTGEKRQLREVLDRVAICATALSIPSAEGGLGLTERPEEIVGIFSENVMEYATLVYSLLKIAVPFSLLPAYSTVPELVALLELSDVTRLFISPTMQATALKAAEQASVPLDRIHILQGHFQGFKTLSDIIEAVRAQGSFRVPARSIHGDHLAYMAFSSGTTGFPKAVMVSHRNLYYSAMQVAVIGAEVAKAGKVPSLAHTPEGVHIGLAFMPFYHAAALHLSMLRGALMPPTTIVILPKWNVDQVFKAIERYRVTNLIMAPSMTHQMIFSRKFKSADLSSVMGFVIGAAHLDIEHRKAVVERMPQLSLLSSTYGLTECVVTALQLPMPGLFAGRFSNEVLTTMTGILMPGMEARILRDDGNEADYDEPGDYVDRLKDTLKVSGAQVSPSEIEHVLLQQPDKLIVDVTVAGVPGDRLSDEKIPRAWVVLSEEGRRLGNAAVIAALDEWVRSQMARHKALQGGIEVVEQLPKSPTGKVLRRSLQDKITTRAPDDRNIGALSFCLQNDDFRNDSVPHLKSLYPSIPHVQATNLPDSTLYVDGLTGETGHFRAYVDRVSECASALASSEVSGGLDIMPGNRELVGILARTACPALIGIAREAAREAGFSEDRIYVLQGDVQGFKNIGNLIEDIRSTTIQKLAPCSARDDNLAYLAFSSGTSGLPKAVMISRMILISSMLQAMVIGREFAKDAKPTTSSNPRRHSHRLRLPAILPCHSIPSVHTSDLHSANHSDHSAKMEFGQTVGFNHEVLSPCIAPCYLPSMVHQLVNSPRLAITDLSSIIGFGTGAAHLPTEERQKLIKHMPNAGAFAGGYGMTECTISAMLSPLPGLFNNQLSREALMGMTGISNPSVEARIVRDDGSEPGELLLRGPNSAMGYWRNENATVGSFLADGWLRTGDRFWVEPNGYPESFWEQVSPSEIEYVLLQHPEKLITDVSVAGVPGTRFSDEKVPQA
ncbi:hypothetical protein EVG20_g1298 [Dentipellis fragilis]|uniref:AMP-dependent synthetase/ligase domain-containing protein n=1 Tax=Dentipellis fragilis TaxID=205917 RepID=A0A4Y9ZA24_9AGAM|nr:hypothetical protein EVG20_g1298 [Dentipellis fragilis]